MNMHPHMPCAVYHTCTLEVQRETCATAFGSPALARWLQGRILLRRLWEVKSKQYTVPGCGAGRTTSRP